MELINKIPKDWRDLVTRALWTFSQSFLAVLAVSQEPFTSAAVVAAAAAGLSAVKTWFVNRNRD
jgi:hypothetical protein